jgi:hypothetical protein
MWPGRCSQPFHDEPTQPGPSATAALTAIGASTWPSAPPAWSSSTASSGAAASTRAPTGWPGTTTTGWIAPWRRSAGRPRGLAACSAPAFTPCCASTAPTCTAVACRPGRGNRARPPVVLRARPGPGAVRRRRGRARRHRHDQASPRRLKQRRRDGLAETVAGGPGGLLISSTSGSGEVAQPGRNADGESLEPSRAPGLLRLLPRPSP